MKLLLTGFEPFAGRPINPSQEVVRELAERPPVAIELVTAVLPVERYTGPAALLAAIERHHPAAVVCLGEASRRASICLERVAINLLDYQIGDNVGNLVVDEPVVAGAPAAYFTTLPLRPIQAALLAAGIPSELSLSAGAFLCNQVAYVLLHHLSERRLAVPAGFIHLPLLPEQAAALPVPAPSMSLSTMLLGVTLALRVIAGSGS